MCGGDWAIRPMDTPPLPDHKVRRYASRSAIVRSLHPRHRNRIFVPGTAASGLRMYAAAAAVFSEKELADLTYAIGLMNAFNRFGVAFRPAPAAVTAATR